MKENKTKTKNAPENPATASNGNSEEDPLTSYRTMLLILFACTVILVIVMLKVLLTPDDRTSDPSIFILVIMAGALGAFFSVLMRLYNFENLPLALRDPQKNPGRVTMLFYSLVPPVIGAIAASVIYVIFAGHILSGALFPEFICKNQTCDSFSSLLDAYGPAKAEDYAKVLAWGFASGFAERFVPDALLKLTNDSDEHSDNAN